MERTSREMQPTFDVYAPATPAVSMTDGPLTRAVRALTRRRGFLKADRSTE